MRHTALALTLLLSASSSALAQTPADAPKACPDCAMRRKEPDSQSVRTFYLKYARQAADINEIGATIRQLIPDAKTFVIPAEDAIMVRAIPEDMALAERAINDLDHPKKAWRLTYTLTEMDGDKRLGTQHYSMDMVEGQQSNLQQDSKVPVPTGTYSGATGPNTSYTYEDAGITFNATLVPQGAGARLQSEIEQNGVAQSGSVSGLVIKRDSALKGAYLLAPNKPLVLGAMDIPGSTHYLEVEALIEPLP